MPPFVSPETAPKDVGFGEAFRRYWGKYAQFRGAASVSEYWWAILGVFLVTLIPMTFLVLAVIVAAVQDAGDNGAGEVSGGAGVLLIVGALLTTVLSLAIIVPSLAIAVRRLHDSGRSGWWYFVTFIPLVGGIVFIILMCTNQDRRNWRPEWF